MMHTGDVKIAQLNKLITEKKPLKNSIFVGTRTPRD